MHKKINLLDISLVSLVFFLLFASYFRPITAMTQDLGRHLITGKNILSTLSVPKTNLYSYTYPDFPFINHHWFSEVVFFIIQNALGSSALLFFMTLLVLLSFGLVFFTAYKHATLISCIVASTLYLGILFERTDLRPEIFSFLFTAMFISVFYTYKYRYTNLIFLLIPLELLWVNTHIYFPLGILLIVFLLLDLLITHRKSLFDKKIKTLTVVLLLSSIVIFLNPNAIQGAFYPLRVFQNYGYTIEENQSVFFLERLGFHKPPFLPLKLATILLFLSLVLTYKKTKPIDWLLAVTFTFFAFSAVRHLPLFVLTTFIPFAISLSHLTTKLTTNPLLSKIKKPAKLLLILILSSTLLFQIHKTISQKGFGPKEVPGAKNAADFFLKNNLKGPIFNNFDIGSYLIYRLYPQEKVFIDGRPEAYPKEFIQETYIPMQKDQALFDKQAEKYRFNTVIFAHTDQTPWAREFLKIILNHPSWKLVYLDSTMLILLKDTPENNSVTEKFAMTKDKVTISSLPPATPAANHLLLAYLFNSAGWIEQEVDMYQRMLKIDPTNCQALYNIAAIFTNQQNPIGTIYTQKYQTHCHR